MPDFLPDKQLYKKECKGDMKLIDRICDKKYRKQQRLDSTSGGYSLFPSSATVVLRDSSCRQRDRHTKGQMKLKIEVRTVVGRQKETSKNERMISLHPEIWYHCHFRNGNGNGNGNSWLLATVLPDVKRRTRRVRRHPDKDIINTVSNIEKHRHDGFSIMGMRHCLVLVCCCKHGTPRQAAAGWSCLKSATCASTIEVLPAGSCLLSATTKSVLSFVLYQRHIWKSLRAA